MAFEAFPDATRVLAVLGKRLARYGLTLHPDKTRLIDFRFKRPKGTHHPAARGTTFDFLGFTPHRTSFRMIQHVEHAPERLGIDIAIPLEPTAAPEFDLDQAGLRR